MSAEPIAQDTHALRQRVDRFVRTELVVLPEFKELVSLAGSFGPAALFGGLIRDLALGYARDFSSDVDVVVKSMPPEALARFATRYGAERNAFGGFRVPMGRWLVDLWTFESTWAFSARIVQGSSLCDLLNTTFFNWDAVLYDLEKRELIAKPTYLEDIQRRWLAINLRETPNELGAAVRTLRLMWQAETTLAPGLAQFLHSQILEHGLHRVVTSDAKHSGRRRLTNDYVGSVAIALRQHTLDRPSEPFSFASFQQPLPLDATAR